MSRFDGNADIGRELHRFFRALPAEVTAVDEYVDSQGLSPRAAEVLKSGNTAAIEKHLAAAGIEEPNIFWPPGVN